MFGMNLGLLFLINLHTQVVVVVLLLEEISFIYLRSTSHLCNGMTKVQSIFLYIRIKVWGMLYFIRRCCLFLYVWMKRKIGGQGFQSGKLDKVWTTFLMFSRNIYLWMLFSEQCQLILNNFWCEVLKRQLYISLLYALWAIFF